MMRRIPIIDAASQRMGLVLNGRRITLTLTYNPTSERWNLDLAIDAVPVLHGRRIVLKTDLIAPFGLGIGAIFALGHGGADVPPDYDALVRGAVRLYHATADDLA